jgi:periplasmic protein TonB
MTPLKETLEAATPVAETTSTQAAERQKSDAGHLRSDAVSLDVPVKVHGSRVTEVVRGITPHTEPFEELTSTMIVFPQGGVLRMTTAVTAGQMVVLTNMKSGHDAICRVVKVRACAPTQNYVELEFTNRQQGYWGVRFATDESEPSRPFVPPPPPIVADAEIEKNEHKSAPQVSWAPAATMQAPPAKHSESASFLTPVKTPSAPESSFVEIGAQEDVQPAASATVTKTKAQRSVAPSVPVSMAELRGDVHAAPPSVSSLGAGVPGEMTDLSEALAESSEHKTPATFGRFAANASLTVAHAAPEKVFGARFDSSALGVSEQSTEVRKDSGHNWFLITAGVAALFVVAVGGGLYFHVLPGAKSASKSEPSLMSAPSPAPAASSEVSSVVSPAQTNSAPIPVSNPVAQISQPNAAAIVTSPVVAVRVENPAPERTLQAPPVARVQPSAPVNQKVPSRAPDISASLNAHPVSGRRSAGGDVEPAPSVDAGTAPSGGELEGLATSSAVPPPPSAAVAENSVRVGGDVKPPKLASTVLPVYPAIARSSGIEGSVVVDASIDTTGSVIATKVISGPVMLRQAAVDALRRWKYSPATLNGEPIAVHITVTLKFSR